MLIGSNLEGHCDYKQSSSGNVRIKYPLQVFVQHQCAAAELGCVVI